MFGSVSQFFRIFFRLLNASYAILFFLFNDFLRFVWISVGFWKVLGGLGDSPGLYLRRFCVHARLRGRNVLNVTKPQFQWVGAHFASSARNATNRVKTYRHPGEGGCL